MGAPNGSDGAEPRVVYVFDAYCGWCYGFDPAVLAFWEANRERVPFDVVSGGLFTGARRPTLGSLGFIREANRRVSRLTCVTFGPAFDALLDDGRLVLDSEGAAAGFAALRAEAPDRAVPLAAALQRRFYVDGESLSHPRTVAAVARAHGLDADRAVAFMTGDDGRRAAAEDFAFARSLGATSFPSLLVLAGDRGVQLPAVGTTPEALGRHLDEALGMLAGAY
jgi:putative protein-disulfide isomerase